MSRLYAHIRSFGCQMNKLDTAMVSAALSEAGMELTERASQADLVIINTCSVRDHAEQRVWSHLGHLQHIKRSRPGMVVAVIGCMAQRLGTALLEHPAVDVVCGPMHLPRLVQMCLKAIQDKSKMAAITTSWRADADTLDQLEVSNPAMESPGQAYVRVMRGCNRSCAYCIVPFVRGPEHSRAPQAVLEQVRILADRGARQVTLLGQTVNAYRYRLGERTVFLADLLEMVGRIEGIEWIKFVTSYPMEHQFEPILQQMATNPKVCPYLHLPAQSGSDRILAAMNRRYTASQYLRMIEKAKAMVPGIAIAGDFIVGFPGETDEDFQQTLDLVHEVGYKNCFVFRYSPRPGTPAYRLGDPVPDHIKASRNAALLAAQQQISERIANGFVGRTVKVLVEGPSKRSDRFQQVEDLQQLVGRTDTDWPVVFTGPMQLAGQFVHVRIAKASPFTLFGDIYDPKPDFLGN